MRTHTMVGVLMLSFLGFAALAQAEEGVRVRPIDAYISGFGGYSFPFKSDLAFQGRTTISNMELDKSPSFGGKVGMWFTAPRKRLGVDIGVEVDVTNFNPDVSVPLPLALNATYFGVHVLARVPMEVTQDLPNGKWFPYVGFGGGGQRLAFQLPGTTEGRHTAPAFQGLWGAKVFITKHIALFGEGKYTYASHSMEFLFGPVVLPPLDLTVHALHGVGGLSVHF